MRHAEVTIHALSKLPSSACGLGPGVVLQNKGKDCMSYLKQFARWVGKALFDWGGGDVQDGGTWS